MYGIESLFWATIWASLLVLIAKQIRNRIGVLRRVFVPSTLIAGCLGLLAGPEVLGRLLRATGVESDRLAEGLWPSAVRDVWTEAPVVLISVVFAGLFLGKEVYGIRRIWSTTGPMVMHGQTLAWGQYVVGLLVTVLVLVPVWGIDPMAGALIEIGFEGGHGTAAGLSNTFESLGFEDGKHLAIGLATMGVVIGVVLGTVLVNWGVSRGHISPPEESQNHSRERSGNEQADTDSDDGSAEKQEHNGSLRDLATNSLTLHLGLIGAAVGVGWLLLEALKWFEVAALTPLGWPEVFQHVPLFPLAMIGGVLIQICAAKCGVSDRINRRHINRISGVALDILIVAAVATLSVSTIGQYFMPFVILCCVGVAWNLFVLLVFAPRIFEKHWLQYGLADFGQSTGMTILGLLLLRMTDPNNETGAIDAFGYKQLLFEPIVGGGIFTAASLPLIAQFGPVPVLIGVSVVTAGWLAAGLLRLGLPQNGRGNSGHH